MAAVAMGSHIHCPVPFFLQGFLQSAFAQLLLQPRLFASGALGSPSPSDPNCSSDLFSRLLLPVPADSCSQPASLASARPFTFLLQRVQPVLSFFTWKLSPNLIPFNLSLHPHCLASEVRFHGKSEKTTALATSNSVTNFAVKQERNRAFQKKGEQ